MRVIGAGLALFLAVTAILLYQVTPDGHETIAQANVADPAPVVTAPPSPATSPTSVNQPTQEIPTPVQIASPAPPPATAVQDEPTVDVEEQDVALDEPDMEEPLAVESETNEEPESVDEVAEPVGADDGEEAGSQAYLAGVDDSDVWSEAIETPNGGKIGIVLSGLANVRELPTVDAEIVDVLHAGWPVAIYGVVAGDSVSETDIWYQISGGYVAAELIGPYTPREPEVFHVGHWVDVDLTHNVAVAYINDVPVNAVIVITGKTGFETPVGEHTVFARVENETLDSATVGIAEGDPEYYYLPDVPHTQYFASGGFAIHANYWSDPWQFGSSTSHGCVNMFPEDAAWFWWFLDIGSVVSVRY